MLVRSVWTWEIIKLLLCNLWANAHQLRRVTPQYEREIRRLISCGSSHSQDSRYKYRKTHVVKTRYLVCTHTLYHRAQTINSLNSYEIHVNMAIVAVAGGTGGIGKSVLEHLQHYGSHHKIFLLGRKVNRRLYQMKA